MLYNAKDVRKIFVILIVLGLALLTFAVFLFVKGKQGGIASLQITSIPPAVIFIDGKKIGKTPYRDNVATGDHTVKIIPDGAKGSFEQKLTFLPNILTVLDRSFDESGASGHTLTLSPLSDKNDVQITVISTPTGAAVTLDSELKGITPLLIKDVTASDHELIVAKGDYKDRIVRIKTAAGYKLVANVDLAVNLNPSPTATPSTSPSASLSTNIATTSAQVRINQTPTGFLRVRLEPSLSATEVAKVNPGDSFPLLDEQTGWFKIKLPDGKEGWISNQYASKITQ